VKQFKEIAYAANQLALDEAKQQASEKIRNWLASKSDSKYTKVYGHNAKRDRMSSSVVEGMNAADGTVYHGTGIRALTPGKMLEAIVFHSAKRADNRRESARNASPTGATPGVVSLLKERKEEAEGKLKFRTVTFLGKTRDKAIINHGTPARGRSVNIGKNPSCECGVFALEKIPCGCMLIVCEEAGIDPALLLEARDTAKFWKELYEDLPEIAVPGSEFLAPGQSGLLAPPAKPIAPGRPSTKRIKGAMDKVHKMKASALSSQHE